MRNTIILTTIAAFLLGSVTIASAGSAENAASKPRTDPFSASVNHVFDVILQPLDAATRPVNDLLKPVTGSPSFAGASSTMPTTRNPVAAGTNTNINPTTAPTTASKTVPVL